MLRPKILIIISQQPTTDYPTRSDTFILDFVNDLEVSSSWKNLTDTAKFVIPKNIIFKTKDGNSYDLSGKGKNITAGINPPFILRGDRISIEAGYWFYDAEGNEQRPPTTTIFNGFISKVKIKIPIEIECEDNMWLLKQTTAPNKVFKGTLEAMVKELITPLGFSLVDHPQGITTNVGVFRTQDETIGEVLDRLRKDLRIESWFRGNNLHCSSIVYFPNEIADPQQVFEFQSNIIDDSLDYSRIDDITLGANAISVNKVELTGTNADGKSKTKSKRLEAFVGKKGGEVRTLYFFDVTSEAELKKMGEERLRRFYYEGYRGKFTTFGEPFVKHGDIIKLRDKVLPEREGEYFVKSVNRKFGVSDGYRQEIEIDIRADVFNKSEIEQGL